jgi:hypothetical protein
MLRRGSIRGSISRSIIALLLTSKLLYRVGACVGVLPAACCLLPAACCLLPAACCLQPASGYLLQHSLMPPPLPYPHVMTSASSSSCHHVFKHGDLCVWWCVDIDRWRVGIDRASMREEHSSQCLSHHCGEDTSEWVSDDCCG